MVKARLIGAVGIVAFVLVAGAGPHADDSNAPIAIYVFTAATSSGFVDADSKQRTNGLRDLIHELKGDKTLHPVESKDAADVILEVLHNRLENSDATIVDAACSMHTGCITHLHVKLTAGDYTAEIVGSTFAAHNAAQQIEKWIDENRAKLLNQRTK